jgi:succinate dehydrogenase hydrophobic anchor subunit
MSRTRWHLVSIFSAVVIAVLLGIHMVIQHLDAILRFFGIGNGEPTSWLAVMSRSASGVWTGLYIALLAFVLYHAFYGLRGIILEVTTSSRAGRVINVAFIVVGIAVFMWGSSVPLTLLSG